MKAGDAIFSTAQGKSQKRRNETDHLIMFLDSHNTGIMLIIYGYEPNGSLYNMKRFVPEDYIFFPLNSTTSEQQRFFIRRILSDKLSRWEV